MPANADFATQPVGASIPQDFSQYGRAFAALAHNPPLTLLIEGGTAASRFNAALFWAMLANCQTDSETAPCMQCPACRQILAKEHQDILMYDGRISNREDEENPGTSRALSMENMRALKSRLGSAPRSAKKRVVIIDGMTTVREEALNSLLKVLEEPAPETLFVLLTPLREQILPTLTSRSLCVTLPWEITKPEETPLQKELGNFLQTGKGFLATISQKGVLDSKVAENLLIACQNCLLAGYKNKKPANVLEQFFANIRKNPTLALQTQFWLNEAMEMLILGASPARCLEGFAARLHVAAQTAAQRVR